MINLGPADVAGIVHASIAYVFVGAFVCGLYASEVASPNLTLLGKIFLGVLAVVFWPFFLGNYVNQMIDKR